MDPLDRLAGPAGDLLRRVDETLAAGGAPEGHPIWPPLRRMRALPGEAVAAVAALRPAPLADAGNAVRALIREYDDARASLDDGGSWEGAGAEAFAAHRDALAAHLTGGPESLTGRLDTTAGYADALADRVRQSRAALARTLAEVLGSTEAVTVVAGGPDHTSLPAGTARGDGRPVRAGATVDVPAADIGARVLATVAEVYDRAEDLLHRWGPSLAELTYRAPIEAAGGRLDTTMRIGGD
jgi:hypothetical protein